MECANTFSVHFISSITTVCRWQDGVYKTQNDYGVFRMKEVRVLRLSNEKTFVARLSKNP